MTGTTVNTSVQLSGLSVFFVLFFVRIIEKTGYRINQTLFAALLCLDLNVLQSRVEILDRYEYDHVDNSNDGKCATTKTNKQCHIMNLKKREQISK